MKKKKQNTKILYIMKYVVKTKTKEDKEKTRIKKSRQHEKWMNPTYYLLLKHLYFTVILMICLLIIKLIYKNIRIEFLLY